MPAFDVGYARRQFPQFRDPATARWAFFENAGGAYAPDAVISLLERYYSQHKLQPGYGYAPSQRAAEAMQRSQRLLGDCYGCAADEILLGPSTTMNVYVLAQALVTQMTPGDEIIVTDLDHEANVGAWRSLEARGMVIRQWHCDATTGVLALDDLENLLSERSRLVCVTHCSNVIGVVNPVREIVQLAHAAGARVVIDGVSHVPHAAVNLTDLGADFYLFSLYKVFGPHLGVLYVSRSLQESLPNQGHFFNAARVEKRLLPAGPNHAENVAAAGVVDYFEDLIQHHGIAGAAMSERVRGLFQQIGSYERNLAEPIRDWLTDRPGVRVLGPQAPAADRAPIVSFVPESPTPAQVVARLGEREIGCGNGNFYAYRLFERLNLDPARGAVRISLAHYNTAHEVERLLTALGDIL